jgi:hypothetical protein
MKLTVQEEKIARLALNSAAQPGEIASAANKLICLWRNRKITAEQISWNQVTFIDRIVYQDRIVQAPPLPPEIVYQDRIVFQDRPTPSVGKNRKTLILIGFSLSLAFNIVFGSQLPNLKHVAYTLSELKQYRKEWAQEKKWDVVAKADKKIAEMEAKKQTEELD